MRIDMDKCINCGTCYGVYPNLVNDEREIIKKDMTEEEKNGLIWICPVWAIIDE